MSKSTDAYIDEMNMAVDTLAGHLARGEWYEAARFILFPNEIEPESELPEHLGVIETPTEQEMLDMAEASEQEK